MATPMPVVDLRQYTTRPGKRDELIEVFDQEFVEGQEADGMHIIGQFRDLDDPDRFVWLRGFADLPARARALPAFYGGPVWKEHGRRANSTMLDSDDALLLRPVETRLGYPAPGAARPPLNANAVPSTVVAGALYHRASLDDGLTELFRDVVEPVLRGTGAAPVVWFESLVAGNDFPALPLRDELVLAWFALLDDDTAYDTHRRELNRSQAWQRTVLPELERRFVAPAQQLRLRPTARSQFGATRTAP
jgi:NIPSNAP